MSRTPPATRFGRVARQVRHGTEAVAAGLAAAAVSMSSPRTRFTLGSALGTLAWAVDGRHRRVAARNVRLAYTGTMDQEQMDRLVLASMRHLARVALETLALSGTRAASPPDNVRVEGLEHLHEALAAGRGALLFTGHVGHWELLFHVLGRAGVSLVGIKRPLDNPRLERRLLRSRTSSGNRLVDRAGALREALPALRDGRTLAMLIDQRPKSGGIPVPFFGRPAHTTEALALLALRTGAPVVPGLAWLERDTGRTIQWRVAIERPVPVVRTGELREDCYRITADCTATVERWVRRHPDQWLWAHRRWKAPAGTAS